MNQGHYSYYYFIGIGGIGMSALARYFSALGEKVAGYDRTPSPLTGELEKEGMTITFDETTGAIPALFRQHKEETLVVYTPAVPKNHPQLVWFTENGFRIMKRSEALGHIFNRGYGIAVSGTHGKTTISTLISHLFYQAGQQVTAFLGGISMNFHSNLLLAPSCKYIVAEADEFDRSFLQLSPEVAVITAMDADHLDIYGTKEEVIKAFNAFACRIKPGGHLLVKEGLPLQGPLAAGVKVWRYGVSGKGDFAPVNVSATIEGHHFDLKTPSGQINGFEIKLPGMANVENAVAALAVCFLCGLDPAKLCVALASFRGVSRRFEIRINTPTLAFVDDYGHHPEEIKAFIRAMRDRFPKRHLTGIFQPHLYTRTRDFASEFAKSLSLLDRLILLDIYPAREKPISGVSSELILNAVTLSDKVLCRKGELLSVVSKMDFDVVATMGAGDIETLTGPLEMLLKERAGKIL